MRLRSLALSLIYTFQEITFFDVDWAIKWMGLQGLIGWQVTVGLSWQVTVGLRWKCIGVELVNSLAN